MLIVAYCHAAWLATGNFNNVRLSGSVTPCIVAKLYILQQKCLNKWIGSAPYEHDFTIFNTLRGYADTIPSIFPPHGFESVLILICPIAHCCFSMYRLATKRSEKTSRRKRESEFLSNQACTGRVTFYYSLTSWILVSHAWVGRVQVCS